MESTFDVEEAEVPQASQRVKVDTRPLRVYRDHSDKQGVVICVSHRDRYFTLVPSAFGCGEYGGTCERCESR